MGTHKAIKKKKPDSGSHPVLLLNSRHPSYGVWYGVRAALLNVCVVLIHQGHVISLKKGRITVHGLVFIYRELWSSPLTHRSSDSLEDISCLIDSWNCLSRGRVSSHQPPHLPIPLLQEDQSREGGGIPEGSSEWHSLLSAGRWSGREWVTAVCAYFTIIGTDLWKILC